MGGKLFSDNLLFFDSKTPSKMGGYPSLIPMQSAEYSEYLYNATKKCLLFSISCDTLWWHAQGMPPVGSHLLVGFREEIRAPRGDGNKLRYSN